MLGAMQKVDIIKSHGKTEQDTGSPEVQIALVTARIKDLQPHFEKNKKDVHSRQGLMRLVALRRKQLKYLKSVDILRYRKIIADLGIRGN